MNVKLLEEISNVGSRLEKERLIAQFNPDDVEFLKLALDPMVTFGVTVSEGEESRGWKPVSQNGRDWWKEFRGLLIGLSTRDMTGNVASKNVERALDWAPDYLTHKWGCRILNRNLRAGFDISTLNKVFGAGTVKKFGVQLAETYDGEELEGVFYVQPKLDGNRVVLIDGKGMSRNGHEYPNCGHVIDAIMEMDPHFFEKWVVDGEMMGDLGFDQSSGALRRIHQKDRQEATFTYWAFDLVDRQEWDARSTRPLVDRLADLQRVFHGFDDCLKVVPTLEKSSPTHAWLMKKCEEYMVAGFEGAMVKDVISPYVFKRGKNLLKVKKFFDVDLKITGFYEGKGRHRGRLGGIHVENADASITTKVGSGFSDDLREEIWADRANWLGAVVQIQCQDKTKDGSLRFPVFIMRRKDKEE
jgi:DNA ligase 1